MSYILGKYIKYLSSTILICSALTIDAAVTVKGNVDTTRYYLLEMLSNFNQQDHKFRQMHLTWLQPIKEMLAKLQAGSIATIPSASAARYFNREDAAQILKPILANNFDFDLNPKTLAYFPVTQEIMTDSRSKTDVGYLRSKQAKQATYQVSKQIADIVAGEVIILVGQTPVYIGAMLKALNAELPSQQKFTIIDLPFSGRPDLNITDRKPATWGAAFKNILTPAKEQYFRTRMQHSGYLPGVTDMNITSKQLSAIPKKIYILDYSSGPSIAALLNLFVRWYSDLRLPYPDLVFLNLAKHEDIEVAKDGKFIPMPKDTKLQLNFNDLKFTVDIINLNLNKKTFLAFADLHDNLRYIPNYNCHFWQQANEHFFQEYPRLQAERLYRKYQNYYFSKSKELTQMLKLF